MDRRFLDILVCPFSKTPFKLETLECEGEQIEFGLLRSEAGEYPIVGGIPILFRGQSALIERLRAQRYREALAQATMEIPPPNAGSHTHQSSPHTGGQPLGMSTGGSPQASRLQEAADLFFPEDGTRLSSQCLFDRAYRKLQLHSPGFFNYNFYRFSSPSFLVALSFIHALEQPDGLVLDLACGAGHVTWALQNKTKVRPTIGLDRSFLALHVARTSIVPDAWLVCGDVTPLPFHDETFSVVFSADSFFHFSNKWVSLKEIERVLNSSGVLMLTGLRNKQKAQSPLGQPLTSQEYVKLMDGFSYRVIPDDLVVQRYLEGYGLPNGEQVQEQFLDQAFSVSIWAGKSEMALDDKGSFDYWPHAEGVLGVNPLYMRGPSNSDGTVFLRRFPLDLYTEHNPDVQEYLPKLFLLTSPQKTMMEKNCTDGLTGLIQCFTVLGFPPRYLD